MTKQKRETARRKARQQRALRNFKVVMRDAWKGNAMALDGLARVSFDRLPQIEKQRVVENFANPANLCRRGVPFRVRSAFVWP